MNHLTIYYVATWTSAIIAFITAIAYFVRPKVIMDNFSSLGYPAYLPILLGVWKALGAIALVAPVSPVLREWAYAGFTFNYTGALISHLACKEYGKVLPPLIVLGILAISYFFNPTQLHF